MEEEYGFMGDVGGEGRLEGRKMEICGAVLTSAMHG